jgi:hypothetical protein
MQVRESHVHVCTHVRMLSCHDENRPKNDGTWPFSAEEEEALLQLAQQASLEEAAKRDTALKRLEARLACPWNLSICSHTDDQGNCQVRRSGLSASASASGCGV